MAERAASRIPASRIAGELSAERRSDGEIPDEIPAVSGVEFEGVERRRSSRSECVIAMGLSVSDRFEVRASVCAPGPRKRPPPEPVPGLTVLEAVLKRGEGRSDGSPRRSSSPYSPLAARSQAR